MIYLIASMQKAGSIWVLAMVNDLVVRNGGYYFGDVRNQFRLGWFVRQSGHLPNLQPQTAAHLLLTQLARRKFALHTHSEPSWSIRALMKMNVIRSVYVYRDPRDVARSMFEHGKKIRDHQIRSETTFDQLETMEDSIRFASTFIDAWRQWTGLAGVLTTTYELLRQDAVGEMVKIVDHLGLSASKQDIEKVVDRYQPSSSLEVDTHLNKAVVGAWKDILTPDQVELCHQLFGSDIEEMGYEL